MMSGDLSFKETQALFHPENRFKNRGQLLPDGAAFLQGVLLGQVACTEPFGHGNGPIIRRIQSGQDAHQRGFSAAVYTDNPGSVACLKGKRDIFKDFIDTERFGKSGNL